MMCHETPLQNFLRTVYNYENTPKQDKTITPEKRTAVNYEQLRFEIPLTI